jgi:radical SAM superfamily enzyme YgiQ (UPF0313 family)
VNRASLREPGAVLLVSCYELGHQPLGLAWPLAFLERAGFAPESLDLAAEQLDEPQVRRARVVAFSVPMHTALRLGARAARRVREINPDAFILFFGLYATLNRDFLLADSADAVVGGENEEALVQLALALDSGGPLPASAAAPRVAKLDFPVPSRGRLRPLSDYASLEIGGERRAAGYVEASRGCLHQCRHCPIPPVYSGRFLVVPREIVLEDIRSQVALGARHISFGDPDFLNGPRHSLRIVREMHREFPDLTFDFTAKVEHLLERRALLAELAELGCVFIITAVESLSDRVLAILDKGHTRADVEVALDAVRAAGITLRPTFVPFTPWATLDDYRELLDWVDERDLVLNVDPVQYCIRLLVPPGSLLQQSPELIPYLGELDEASFTYRWTHPDPRMDQLHGRVTELVAEATRVKEDPLFTFDRIRRLAGGAERRASGPYQRPLLAGARPPRLTEPWFC